MILVAYVRKYNCKLTFQTYIYVLLSLVTWWVAEAFGVKRMSWYLVLPEVFREARFWFSQIQAFARGALLVWSVFYCPSAAGGVACCVVQLWQAISAGDLGLHWFERSGLLFILLQRNLCHPTNTGLLNTCAGVDAIGLIVLGSCGTGDSQLGGAGYHYLGPSSPFTFELQLGFVCEAFTCSLWTTSGRTRVGPFWSPVWGLSCFSGLGGASNQCCDCRATGSSAFALSGLGTVKTESGWPSLDWGGSCGTCFSSGSARCTSIGGCLPAW